MAEPRRLKDPAALLFADFTAAMNTDHATLPCAGGSEWTSEDPCLLQRAAELCVACSLLPLCRAYVLASGERSGTWGGLTPLDRKRLRRRGQAAA